jgi:thiol-disulfide isomerase/thioredoxin
MNLRRIAILGTAALSSLALTLGVAVSRAPEHPAAAASTLDPIVRYTDWVSARPGAADFHGKVVLVDIFTFGCYNCKNVTPNLRALYKAHHNEDLEIVGIHTPETPYERDRSNVVTNLANLGIVWPVAIDNENHLWNAYDTEYWPTQLIFDKHGVLRKTVIGDSQDQLVDDTVRMLLAEK